MHGNQTTRLADRAKTIHGIVIELDSKLLDCNATKVHGILKRRGVEINHKMVLAEMRMMVSNGIIDFAGAGDDHVHSFKPIKSERGQWMTRTA